MFLSRLTLRGFKSYSDGVAVDFGPQIAVIIGSNGVGKSNALEGIIWALGEDNPWALRCRTPKDLLFSGSRETEPAREALVGLTFDDNGSERHISRCITFSGQEEFIIDGEQVTSVEEFRKALYDQGLGFARHNIIRQEELTDFFTKPPDARKKYLQQYVSSAEDFQATNVLFDGYVKALIPNSSARIVHWGDGEHVDVEVIFPDKGSKWGVLLSGGERAATALALKLALFQLTPSPFFMLDEVEPALDWTRNHNMQELLKTLSQNRQLIMVTHFQSTIQMANTVHGVRVRPDGSSWLKFHFVMDEKLFKIYKCC